MRDIGKCLARSPTTPVVDSSSCRFLQLSVKVPELSSPKRRLHKPNPGSACVSRLLGNYIPEGHVNMIHLEFLKGFITTLRRSQAGLIAIESPYFRRWRPRGSTAPHRMVAPATGRAMPWFINEVRKRPGGPRWLRSSSQSSPSLR